MPSPYPVTAAFGSLIFAMRHLPQSAADHQALAGAVLHALEGAAFDLDAEPETLRVTGEPVMLDAPGATSVNEQMLLHGLRRISAGAEVEPGQLIRLAAVLAAFAGTYMTFEDVGRALGPAAGAFHLEPGLNEFEVFRAMPFRPRAIDARVREGAMPIPGIQRDEASEFERIEGVSLDPDAAGEVDPHVSLDSGLPTPPRPSLDVLLRRGREAIAQEDWSGLLETALQIVEAEAEAPSDLAGSTYRIELKRLMSRKHLAAIARLAHGERKQETVALLRRFGADSTEILMDLLIEALSMGERRGYYSALTQMSEGSEAIVGHLGHSQWYVIRNAADLCGEMRIAEAVPELARQAQHPDERVRKSVAEALGKIGTTAAVEPLRQMLSDTSDAVRLQAVAHLGGRGARSLTPAIGEMLKTEQNVEVQYEALRALGRIGTPDAILLLRDATSPGGKLVGRKSVPFRVNAIRALGMIGPSAQDALLALSTDESPEVRTAAAEALAAFRP
jgi:HEAT repeat protein